MYPPISAPTNDIPDTLNDRIWSIDIFKKSDEAELSPVHIAEYL